VRRDDHAWHAWAIVTSETHKSIDVATRAATWGAVGKLLLLIDVNISILCFSVISSGMLIYAEPGALKLCVQSGCYLCNSEAGSPIHFQLPHLSIEFR
jgi:hypothetical protein